MTTSQGKTLDVFWSRVEVLEEHGNFLGIGVGKWCKLWGIAGDAKFIILVLTLSSTQVVSK